MFETLCVARCRHDYGLRISLAKEVEGQMSIVTQFTMTFQPNLGPSSVVDQRYGWYIV